MNRNTYKNLDVRMLRPARVRLLKTFMRRNDGNVEVDNSFRTLLKLEMECKNKIISLLYARVQGVGVVANNQYQDARMDFDALLNEIENVSASNLNLADDVSGNDLNCNICYHKYDNSERMPLVPDCQHAICKKCFITHYRARVTHVKCPFCNVVYKDVRVPRI